MVFNPNLKKNTLYKIECKQGYYLYVTDSLKLLIEKSILKSECDQINITQIKSGDIIF